MATEETPAKQDTRLHVVLRIFLYLLAFFIGTGIFQLIGVLIAGIPLEELNGFDASNTNYHLILSLWGLVPLAFFTYIFRKNLDRKSILSLGFSLRGRGLDWFAGCAVALVIIGGGAFILNLAGYVKVEFLAFDYKMLALNLLVFLCVSLTEEVVMRGYVLNNLLEVTNRYVALCISAFLFAIMHGLNPNLSWLAMLNLFLAGIILGATYIFTQNLWFPISLHLFWNFLQGPILGYNVSGQKTESVFKATPKGNSIISGGEFGFEGSVVCSVLIVLFTVAILVYYERKKVQPQN